jgi:16S rRNA (guanine527-N7)-methyltransferase
MTLTSKLQSLIAKTSLQVSEQQVQLLIQYVELLHKWNKAYNLT